MTSPASGAVWAVALAWIAVLGPAAVLVVWIAAKRRRRPRPSMGRPLLEMNLMAQPEPVVSHRIFAPDPEDKEVSAWPQR